MTCKKDSRCLSCKDPSLIFVYGSNLQGINGAGAALHAAQCHGAVKGIGFGMSGNCFAIPTKNEWLQVLPLNVIHEYIKSFIQFAESSKDKKFFITPIGTGLSGYSHIQIAPLFTNVPTSCILPSVWKL